ncbi:pilus assembly protein TadG-related protein [Actinospica robiniae]|uniref:pilus assembly protein TadG-related protein n=1 Tax=Actinospica robiniae TaxID=304901 RepID=UPI00040249BA|nr:pilus assembly protein TadG-related protein [Actinospica robiniae]
MRSRCAREDREQGSATFIMIGWALVVWVLLSVVVDVGLAISQRERAADFADQAARAEAQNLDLGTLQQSGTAAIANDGCARAKAYLLDPRVRKTVDAGGVVALDTSFGNEGANKSADGCQLGPGNTVTVSVHITYKPLVFDAIFGGGSITVTETGTATVQAGIR